MKQTDHETIRNAVRDQYGKIAAGSVGCGCSTPSCCESSGVINAESLSATIGYSAEELAATPTAANLGLGCGNPQAIAGLQPGETVLDLGSGGGFDCFLAARAVGEKGRVIGVDMTPEMITRARQNIEQTELTHVEFRLGELEHLPVADGTVDVIISNCVINLSPEKEKVFGEAFRVLKPGGRLAISDIVAAAALPEDLKSDLKLHAACIAGAATVTELTVLLDNAGFEEICITPKAESKTFIRDWVPGRNIEDYVTSATIEAVKPG
jgi:arsenite methyltransferase